MSSAEADTLHASAMCSETVHTAAVLSGTRSFLTDITAHRLRLPYMSPRCTDKLSYQDYLYDETIQPTLHSIESMLPAACGAKETGWLSDADP